MNSEVAFHRPKYLKIEYDDFDGCIAFTTCRISVGDEDAVVFYLKHGDRPLLENPAGTSDQPSGEALSEG